MAICETFGDTLKLSGHFGVRTGLQRRTPARAPPARCVPTFGSAAPSKIPTLTQFGSVPAPGANLRTCLHGFHGFRQPFLFRVPVSLPLPLTLRQVRLIGAGR